jgi:hypothetical protein
MRGDKGLAMTTARTQVQHNHSDQLEGMLYADCRDQIVFDDL